MKIVGVYKIQSIIKPERIYIGSTVDMVNRWWTHLYYLRNGDHHSPKLQRHYNKYGEDDLVFEIIETGDYLCKEHLLAREQGWYEPCEYQNRDLPYFNVSKIAGSPNLGMKHSQETKNKIGMANKGKVMSPESRKKISESHRGMIMPEKTRQAIARANAGNKYTLGYRHTEKSKKIWIESHMGHSTSEETRKKISKAHSIPILQYDRNMNFIKEWDSSMSIRKEILVYNIIRSLRDNTKTAGGFIWKYKFDKNK